MLHRVGNIITAPKQFLLHFYLNLKVAPRRHFTSFNALEKIVSGRAVHLVSEKNKKFNKHEPGDIVIRFNEDTQPCHILMTALHEVPCLDHAELIVHTMPPGKYMLTDGNTYSNIDDVYHKNTCKTPVYEITQKLWLEIAESLPKWPTTGMVALELIRRTSCTVINLHGFSVWSELASQISLHDQLYINYSHYPPAIIEYLRHCLACDSRIIMHGPRLEEVEQAWRRRLGSSYDLDFTSLTSVKAVKRPNNYHSPASLIRVIVGIIKGNSAAQIAYSPLSDNGCSSFVREIDLDRLTDAYREWLGVDVTSFYDNTPSMGLYQCEASGLKFFHPPVFSGDAGFYAGLQQNSWYYVDSKWEWDESLKFIQPGSKILEVGSGNGRFLKQACNSKNCTAIGLETNKHAYRSSELPRHASVFNCELRTFIQNYPHCADEGFDVICSFQVLEHITKPLDFIHECWQLLRPGGKMIFAVPNCDGFIKHAREDWCTNYPPHHMTWWSKTAFRYLARVLKVKSSFVVEPIPREQALWASSVILDSTFSILLHVSPRLCRFVKRLSYRLGLPWILSWYLVLTRRGGHSMICVYTK